MSKSILSELSAQWFSEYNRLAYSVARRTCQRLLYRKSLDYSANDLAELAQDAVCRGYDRFAKRCAKHICGKSDRRVWVCQCVVRGARDAIRSKSRFGSISSPIAVRDDAMNRFVRVRAGFVHGTDNEKDDLLEQVGYVPLPFAVQRWELEELIQRELPPNLRLTALYVAVGLTQEQTAILQGVTDRTIRNHLQTIRNHLNPNANIYAVICDALKACMNKQGGQLPLPFRGDAND